MTGSADATRLAPFDTDKLESLMAPVGMDLVLASSRHNVRYLFGGYSEFFAHFDAIGSDRYLPLLGYPRGQRERAFLIGTAADTPVHKLEPSWLSEIVYAPMSSAAAAEAAATEIHRLGLASSTIAVEETFLPVRAFATLGRRLPHATFIDATAILEELRAVKRPDELELLRVASEGIVDSFVAAAHSAASGLTREQLVERVRFEEARRGLDFEYCGISIGPKADRPPRTARWEEGTILSLDSGGLREGYIGDLCRMAVRGEPTALMRELLDEVRAIQDAARVPIRHGALGVEIYDHALKAQAQLPHGRDTVFLAHGMGLVSHEAPRLTDGPPVGHAATHRTRSLEAGMVISIETHLVVEGVGFVKLEDTVAVTQTGCTGFGDVARDWIAVPSH